MRAEEWWVAPWYTGCRFGVAPELAETGERLTQSRTQIADTLSRQLADMASALSADLAGVSVVFRPGWDRQMGLAEALERNAQSDAGGASLRLGHIAETCGSWWAAVWRLMCYPVAS